MTNDELKKKIVDIIRYCYVNEKDYGYIFDLHIEEKINAIADALIAAGIGDLKEHRIFAGKDGSIKQLYSGEEVEKMAKERKELKDELRSKIEYIHEQDEIINEYKSRAARAERALENACVVILSSRNGDQPRRLRAYYKAYLEAAKKELAEEKKDE